MLFSDEPAHDHAPRYESFVLRLRWRGAREQARCQVMLHQVDWAAAKYFGSLQELSAFLEALAPQSAQATDEGDQVTG